MKLTIAFLLLITITLHAAQDGPPWSKPEHGLRGRLCILPPEGSDSPFCLVFIELQNVEKVLGQLCIRLSPDKMKFLVADKFGKELQKENGPYDGMSSIWKPLLLPYNGTIKFQISFPGLGYNPKKGNIIVDINGGTPAVWVIPQDGDYFLSATLSIPKEPGDHPYMDWSGSISFPKVALPQAEQDAVANP